MYSTQILCIVLVLANYVSVRGSYGMGGFGAGGMGGFGGGQAGGMGGYGSGAGYGQENFAPKPYSFGYQAPDQSGNGHFRKEQGDESGNVQGSYGYTDNQGLYRQVDYVANMGGFRANVKTNEPGTDGKENPADINMMAQQPPAGVQEKYTRNSAHGGGASGAAGYGMGSGFGAFGHGGSGGYGGSGGGSSIYGSGNSGSYGTSGLGGQMKFGGMGSGSFSGISRSSSGKSGY